MRRLATLTVGVMASALVIAGCTQPVPADQPPPSPTSMGGMGEASRATDLAPLVKGYYRGGEIWFIHTEASDAQVAEMLTRMMGPRVVLAPALSEAPDQLLGRVFVFTNGVKGDGPFGFQPDIFDTVPSEPSYRPLRAITLVTWSDRGNPRELRSHDEVLATEGRGEVTTRSTGVVVNMPILAWPGGHR